MMNFTILQVHLNFSCVSFLLLSNFGSHFVVHVSCSFLNGATFCVFIPASCPLCVWLPQCQGPCLVCIRHFTLVSVAMAGGTILTMDAVPLLMTVLWYQAPESSGGFQPSSHSLRTWLGIWVPCSAVWPDLAEQCDGWCQHFLCSS